MATRLLTTLPESLFPQADVIALDVETTGLEYDAIVTAIAVSDGEDSLVIDIRDFCASEVLQEWLDEEVYSRRVVVHNGFFDLPRLVNQCGCSYPSRLWDTQIAETLLTAGLDAEEDEETGEERYVSRSLQATVRRRLGEFLDKDQDIRTGFQMDNLWSEEMVQYAGKDAEILIRLYEKQRQAIETEDMLVIASIEMQCVPIFAEMWRRGITVDTERLKVLVDKAQQKASEKELHLQTVLTPYLYWPRMREQEEENRKLQDWQVCYDSEQRHSTAEWDYCTDSSAEGATDNWYREWEGKTIEGSSKPISSAEIDSWLETTPKSKSDPTPKGQSRYVRRMLQYWRTLEGNKRPLVKVVTIDEPINVRSQPQKTDALAEYTRVYNTKLHTDLVPPDNFRRKTLVAYSALCPEMVREEVIDPLLEFTKNDKLVSSFGDRLVQRLRHSVAHGSWRQTGTSTGRPSCSVPNLLQMPKAPEFRRCFRAREGHKLVVADYSQMELRLLAEYSQDPAMIEEFLNDRDIHLKTAAESFKVATEDVTKDQRDVAKVVNFGTSYGMAKYALQYNLAGQKIFVTLEEADKFLQSWRKTFSGAWKWIEQQGASAIRRGWTATPLGRRRYFVPIAKDITDAEWRRQEGKVRREGANHPIQGGNADITKLAMILIQEQLLPLSGSVLLTVYDEVVCEVPEEHAAEAKQIVETAMIAAAESVLKTVPVKVDCVTSPSWDEKDTST